MLGVDAQSVAIGLPDDRFAGKGPGEGGKDCAVGAICRARMQQPVSGFLLIDATVLDLFQLQHGCIRIVWLRQSSLPTGFQQVSDDEIGFVQGIRAA